MPVEFVVDEIKRDVVEQNLQRIQDLFNVRVTITNGTADKIWVTLNGGREEKAKGYIQALTLPEQHSSVVLPASLIGQLGPRSTEHFNLESEYGVVIRYPKDTEAVIAGNAYDVVLASSKLEDLKSKLSNAVTVSKTSKPKNPQPKANRPLAEFASKLGYEQDHIDAVFEKLGPTVDKNTFLNELINLSRYKSKTVDDRRSPAMARSFNWSNGTQQEPFALHASSAMHHSQHPFAPDSAVVARGMIARSSGQTISGNNCPSSGLSSRSYRPLNPGSNPMGYPLDFATYGMESSRVLTRGMIARSSSPTTQGNSSTVYSHPQNNWLEGIPNGLMAPQGSDHGLLNSDPVQVDVMVDQLVTSKYKQCPQSDLRHVVIDGSNVAMSHGNNKVFSCRGIALCVEWFLKRGHTQITVFVPTWRKETARIDNPITDQHLLHQLESQGYLTFTPSRKVNGRRIVCYDDRFVVRLAHTTDGVIVSNDNFKDLAQEKPSWREVIEQRLLMYSFVNDMFMPPDDPLGRHGPTLDEFLRKGTPTHRRQCPYGRRCTYGARCKYHHPEREDQRLPIYQKLKDLFPNQDSLILAAMKKYPHEKDADVLASYVLNMIH